MMLDCDRLWTELVTRIYRLRGKPRITNEPPSAPLPRGPAPGPASGPRRAVD